MEFKIESTDELPGLAGELLKLFPDDRVFLFNGDLGSGKTTFIKVICSALGVGDVMSSPSFGIINEYRSDSGAPVYHLDCYRLEEEEEAYDIGLVEILDSGDYCFVEWPDVIHNLLPPNYVSVHIEVREKQRIFNFSKA